MTEKNIGKISILKLRPINKYAISSLRIIQSSQA